MWILYTSRSRERFWQQNPSKWVALGLCVVAIVALDSCRKAQTPTANEASAKPATQAIQEAERLYAGREDLVKVREGIVALRQAAADNSTNYEIAWRLAKLDYYLGAHSPNSTEQDKAFHDGIDAGKLAVQLEPNRPEGHFWLGANYGGNAEISTLAGLAEIEDIKREMDAVLRIDESFQSGSAYMVLGQVYLESPRLLGGDTQKAIGYFQKGIKLGPNNALLRLRLAQAYAQDHQNAAAQKELSELEVMKPTPGYEPEYTEAIGEAHKLKETIK